MLILQNAGFFLPYWDLCKNPPIVTGPSSCEPLLVRGVPSAPFHTKLPFPALGSKVLYERSCEGWPNGSLCHSCGWCPASEFNLLKLSHSGIGLMPFQKAGKAWSLRCGLRVQELFVREPQESICSHYHRSFRTLGFCVWLHLKSAGRTFEACSFKSTKTMPKGIEASRKIEKSFQPRGHAMTTHI